MTRQRIDLREATLIQQSLNALARGELFRIVDGADRIFAHGDASLRETLLEIRDLSGGSGYVWGSSHAEQFTGLFLGNNN